MCGIAGALNFSGSPVPLKQIQSMAEAIRHRGPDDEGYYCEQNVGLGFRRLAIIDLSPAGHQPMTNEDGRIVLIYNGEIYNFRELRKQLERRGHRFRSQTDTEVIVHAYEQYGENCVKKFKGMFAFALWDIRSQKLFCARDRLGIKPFYYFIDTKYFLFGSEIKAILAATRKPRQLNFHALREYFTFQNVISDQTLFTGVRLLPAGHAISISGSRIRVWQYWDAEFQPTNTTPQEILEARIRKKFEEAIQHHLISDVPVGSHLSGGMDSGAIVARASHYLPHLMTFTGGFDTTDASGIEMFFDERQDAEVIARTYGTRHYEMVVHAGDMGTIFPELIWHLEDLRVGMCYQNYYINQLASKFVKVVLAGTGGDELFGGYPWRYQLMRGIRDNHEFEKKLFGYWSRLIKEEDKPRAFTADAWKQMKDYFPWDPYISIIRKTRGQSALNRTLYFEMKTFLHGLLLVEDKVSSAHSLESRVPFLDTDLIDIALSIPSSFKVRGTKGKYILRRSLQNILPQKIIKRKKQGFSAPEETWYRGKAYEYVRSILLSPRTIQRGIFQESFLQHIIEHHHHGLRNYRLLIWSLLAFEWWNRIFIDGDPIAREDPHPLHRRNSAHHAYTSRAHKRR